MRDMRFYGCTQVRVVRIFNTYGPRMALDDGRVVSNFVAQALTDQPLTVYGDGQQTRSFQYVSDLIKGLALCCKCTIRIAFQSEGLHGQYVPDVRVNIRVPCVSKLAGVNGYKTFMN